MIKEERKRRKKRKRRLWAFLIFLCILAIAALVVIKVFTVENVEVEGNELYESKVIEDTLLSDKYSWNSLYVFLKYRFKNDDVVPFVDTVEVSLKDPHTLHIKVYEKGMLGYIHLKDQDQNVYFDKDGLVVELSSDVIDGVPKIKGISCQEVVLYEQLPIDEEDLRQLLTLTQTLKRDGLVPDSITYGQKYSPVLAYGDVDVYMGSQDLLTQKVERLAKVLPQVAGQKGILHLENWTEETSDIIFDAE